MASSSPKKYPYPLEVNVREFVTLKLSQTNYSTWKSLMLLLIECEGLDGFIHGKIPVPPETLTFENDDISTMENPDYQDWIRTDRLLRRWILSTVNEDFVIRLASLGTAEEMWKSVEQACPQVTSNIIEIDQNIDVGRDISRYLPLYKAAMSNDVEKAMIFINQEPDSVRSIITGFSETALLVALQSAQRGYLVNKLVDMMSTADLAQPNRYGVTALHEAARTDNFEAAMLLVGKNQQLPHVGDNAKLLPIHYAALNGKRRMVRYLLNVTNENAEPKPFEDELGGRLMRDLISGALYDIALNLIQLYPKLAYCDPSPLIIVARQRPSFLSGDHLSIAARFLSSPPWNIYIQEPKQKRYHESFLKRLCTEIVKLDYPKAWHIFREAIHAAAAIGHSEVVKEILDSFPDAIRSTNRMGQTVFHVAILNRDENVFNIIYQFQNINAILSQVDISMNNGLHLAGRLESRQKLKFRSNGVPAALQMQRELQFFQAVEQLSSTSDRECKNSEGKTPAMVFSETHQELIKEGEEWMKNTANSSTIVAALVAAIVFAAAITVPGGNNSNTGLPIFANDIAFAIFAVSDALALIFSISSALLFMSIHTARYSEVDFLKALPARLLFVLTMMFFSTMLMTITFCSALYLVYGQKRRWFLVSLACFCYVPVSLFGLSYYGLTLDMLQSTYGPPIFRKKNQSSIRYQIMKALHVGSSPTKWFMYRLQRKSLLTTK